LSCSPHAGMQGEVSGSAVGTAPSVTEAGWSSIRNSARGMTSSVTGTVCSEGSTTGKCRNIRSSARGIHTGSWWDWRGSTADVITQVESASGGRC
jgi:hypothetical protein